MDRQSTVKKQWGKLFFYLSVLGVSRISKENLPSGLQHFQSLINAVHTTAMLISLTTYCIASIVFVPCCASTFVEYAGSGFFCSVTILHLISYIDLLRTRQKLFALMKDSAELVEKSKSWTKMKQRLTCCNLVLMSFHRKQHRSPYSNHLYRRKQ